MVKFINMLLLTALFLSCRKDKTPDYLSFLYGEWKFVKGAVGQPLYFYPDEFYYEADVNCTLKFEPKGKLLVTFEGNTSEFYLIYKGLIERQDFKLLSFEDGAENIFRFSYIPSLNLLETEQIPLPIGQPECFDNGELLYSQYEKI